MRPQCDTYFWTSPWATSLFALALCAAVGAAAPAAARPLTDADVSPIPLGPNDAEARALIERGRYSDALPLVTADEPGPRLVRGWLASESGAPTEVLRALDGVAEAMPAVAERVRGLRAAAFLTLGRPEAALLELAALGPAREASSIRRYRARALRELGRFDRAREEYRALIDGARGTTPDDVPVGLLGLARLEAADGHPERALPLLRRIDVEFTTHWVQRPAQAMAEALVGESPAIERRWRDRAPEEDLRRGESLLDAHRNREAVAILEPLLDSRMAPPTACRLRYAIGRALRKQRKWKPARPHLEAAVEACTEAHSELLPWARYLAAQAAERLSREKDAAVHFTRLMTDHPEHRLADDAGYFLVRHQLEDRRDPAEARAIVTRLVDTLPRGDMVHEAVFVAALDAIRRGHSDEARSLLALEDRLPPRDTRHRDAGRTAYWRARLAFDAGETDLASAAFEEIVATHPFDWYALMAYSRLHSIDRNRARAVARAALKGESRNGKSLVADLPGGRGDGWRFDVPSSLPESVVDEAVWYARLGLADLAWETLETATRDAPGDDVLWFAAWLLDRAGAHRISHDLLRRRLDVFRRFAPGAETRKHWQIAFPTPFRGLVETNAKATAVDRSLIWAIMREESGFNPKVESFANAVGLMQLILPTAKGMAKKGEPIPTREALTRPDLNIRLGSRYLAYVDPRARGLVPFIAAAYNAGPGSVVRWLGERGREPLDLFVETIPFEEARRYAKRVSSSWATYRYLYGPVQDDPLPYLRQKLPRAPKKVRKGRKRRR